MNNYILYNHLEKPMQVYVAQPNHNNYIVITFLRGGQLSMFDSTSWRIAPFAEAEWVSRMNNISFINEGEQVLIDNLISQDKPSHRIGHIKHSKDIENSLYKSL